MKSYPQIKDEIYHLISQADISSALTLMEKEFYAFRKRITLLQSDFHRLHKSKLHNLASNEQLAIEESRLNFRILNLLDEIEEKKNPGKSLKEEDTLIDKFSAILNHQIDFLKYIIRKFSGTKKLILVATIVPIPLFIMIYFFHPETQEGIPLLLLIGIIFLLIIFSVCLILLINNYIESFKHNKMTLRLHQSLSQNQDSSL